MKKQQKQMQKILAATAFFLALASAPTFAAEPQNIMFEYRMYVQKNLSADEAFSHYATKLNEDTVLLDYTGIYATIDIKKSHAALVVFSSGTSTEKANMAQEMEAHLSDYNPAALFGLGIYYYHLDNPRYAVITSLAEIRSTIDGVAALDNDATALNVIQKLQTEYLNYTGIMSNTAAIKHLKLLKASLAEAVNLDKKLPRNYDQRWIFLYGDQMLVNTFMSKEVNATAISIASAAIQKKIARETYNAFYEFYASIEV